MSNIPRPQEPFTYCGTDGKQHVARSWMMFLDALFNQSGGSSGVVPVDSGGTGSDLSSTGGSHKVVKQTTLGGAFTVSVVSASEIGSGQALTIGSDTNVTLTLGGTPATALLQPASVTVGWAGTLAAGRLNANVVQGVTNDTNVTGTITAQNLTFAWSGQLSTARGGLGQNWSASSGVPLLTAGTASLLSSVGTGTVPLASELAWTPADNSGAALSFSGVSGYYYRVGDLVNITGAVTFPVTVNGSAVQISLPFTAKNVSGNRSGSVTYCDIGTEVTARTLENTASIFFYDSSGVGKTNAQLSGKTLNFCATYVAA